MDNNLLATTYRAPLILNDQKKQWRGGICLSNATFTALHQTSDCFLHMKENNTFQSLTHAKRQHSYLLGRYCAKHAMLATGQPHTPINISIEPGVFQQPVVYGGTPANTQVSISHTATMGAAVAFPEAHPLAIDIELICADNIATLQSQMTDAEHKTIHSADDPAHYLTMLWTIKESLSKVLRCGFMVSFELLEIKTITTYDDHITLCDFKHFAQYQAMSFEVGKAICSIVYPRKTTLDIDIIHLKKIMNQSSL